MNRRLFLAGLGGCLAATTGCQGLHLARNLRVLTYNTHHGEGVDGRLDLDRIARVVRDSGADVAAIQEVDVNTVRTGHVDQAAEYARLTGLQGRYGKAIDLQGGAYGQLILSRWPISDFEVHLLPNPSKREQRIAVSARITPPGGKPFLFVGLHLDATRDDGDRWLQAGRLLELFGEGTDPAVFAGDFNATPESRVMGRVLPRWSDSAAASPAATVPAEKPSERIDFILHRPGTGWTVRRSEVLAEAVASDHRAVLTEFSLPR